MNQDKKKNELTKSLKVTDRHLNIISEALDIYCRLLLGQINSSLWNLYVSREIDRNLFDEKCRQLKAVVFPELHFNSSYGVGWKEDDARQQKSQIAYEIKAMIRHLEGRQKGGEPKYTVSASPPLHYSNEQLIELVDLEMEKAWIPISELPADERNLIIFDEEEGIDYGGWYSNKIGWMRSDGCILKNPTHWREMLVAPKMLKPALKACEKTDF